MSAQEESLTLFVGEFPNIEVARKTWQEHGFELELVGAVRKITVSYQQYRGVHKAEDLSWKWKEYLSEETEGEIQAILMEYDADAVYVVKHHALDHHEHGNEGIRGRLVFIPVKLKPISEGEQSAES